MNYIELINRFWELDEQWQFSCCETRLYFYLLKTANRLGWENSWTHPDAKTAANVGVSPNSMKTARHKLAQANLISFQKGGNGRGDKVRYQILTPKHTPKHTPKQQPFLKPYADYTLLDEINKTKQNNNIVDYNFFIAQFNLICISLPKVQKVTDVRKKKIVVRLKENSREEILEVFRLAEQSDFLSGRSGVWGSCCFDWLMEPKNFVKVLEGNYKNSSAKQSPLHTGTLTVDLTKF